MKLPRPGETGKGTKPVCTQKPLSHDAKRGGEHLREHLKEERRELDQGYRKGADKR